MWRLFLVAGLFTVCGFAQAPRAPESYRIGGVVVHALSGDPLPRTELAIFSASDYKFIRRAFADEAGRFEFDNLAPGKYSLEARRPGFFRQGLNQHENFWTGIAVGPGLESGNVVFRLRPDAAISGTITDNQNEAVPEAQVLLLADRVENGRRATTLVQQQAADDAGRYHFGHLPPGSYFVAVQAHPWYAANGETMTLEPSEQSGEWEKVTFAGKPAESGPDFVYPVTLYPGVTDSAQATPIMLNPGEQASADFVLSPVPSLHLRVKTPAGTPPGQTPSIQLAEELFGGYDLPVAIRGNADRSGELEVGGLPPGQYKLTLQTYGDHPQSWSQSVALYGDMEISPSAAVSPVAISGLVMSSGRAVTSRPMVVLFGPRGRALARVSPEGKFQVTEYLPAGTYEVAVYNASNSMVSGLTASGARTVGRSFEMSGANPVTLVIELSPGVSQVEGVALREGKPEPGAMILLVPRDPEHNSSLVRRDQSDSDGTFTLRGVAPGPYTLLALSHGWGLEWANPAVLRPYLAAGQDVEVTPGKKLQLKVQAQ